MSLIDDILKKKRLKYEDLTHDEKKTFHEWTDIAEAKPLSTEQIVTFIDTMKEAICKQIPEAKEGTEKSIQLKARLKNIMAINELITAPQKAREKLKEIYHSL